MYYKQYCNHHGHYSVYNLSTICLPIGTPMYAMVSRMCISGNTTVNDDYRDIHYGLQNDFTLVLIACHAIPWRT